MFFFCYFIIDFVARTTRANRLNSKSISYLIYFTIAFLSNIDSIARILDAFQMNLDQELKIIRAFSQYFKTVSMAMTENV